MFNESKVKIESFRKIKNPHRSGHNCQFNEDHFIDYLEECYQGPYTIIICCSCKEKARPTKELKYHNVPTVYNDFKYDSSFEAGRAKIYDLLLRTGQIQKVDKQVKIEINIKFTGDDNIPVLTDEPMMELKKQGIKFYHITNYYIDFIITHNDGTLEYVEAKGAETSTWKQKWLLTQAILQDRVLKGTVKLTLSKENGFNIKKKKKKVA